MLNLSQRLILGCVLLACLTAGLVAATHRALAAAGQTTLAYAFVAAALLIAVATVYFVEVPGSGEQENARWLDALDATGNPVKGHAKTAEAGIKTICNPSKGVGAHRVDSTVIVPTGRKSVSSDK